MQIQDIGDDTDLEAPSPVVVQKTPAARVLFATLEMVKNERRLGAPTSEEKSLWARTWEHADKLALLAATLDGTPITEEIAQWAIDLAWACTSTMASISSDYISDTISEENIKKISRLLRSHGSMTLSQITRATQSMRQADRKEALETILQSGDACKAADNALGSRKAQTRITWTGGAGE
jgi:hypothetical protein